MKRIFAISHALFFGTHAQPEDFYRYVNNIVPYALYIAPSIEEKTLIVWQCIDSARVEKGRAEKMARYYERLADKIESGGLSSVNSILEYTHGDKSFCPWRYSNENGAYSAIKSYVLYTRRAKKPCTKDTLKTAFLQWADRARKECAMYDKRIQCLKKCIGQDVRLLRTIEYHKPAFNA